MKKIVAWLLAVLVVCGCSAGGNRKTEYEKSEKNQQEQVEKRLAILFDINGFNPPEAVRHKVNVRVANGRVITGVTAVTSIKELAGCAVHLGRSYDSETLQLQALIYPGSPAPGDSFSRVEHEQLEQKKELPASATSASIKALLDKRGVTPRCKK